MVEFLQDGNLRYSTGEKGKAFVLQNRGALKHVLEIVEGFLDRN